MWPRYWDYLENCFFFSLSFLFFSPPVKEAVFLFQDRQGRGRKIHKELLKWLSKMLITSKNLLKFRSIFNEDCFYKCLSVNTEQYLGSFAWVFDHKFIFQKEMLPYDYIFENCLRWSIHSEIESRQRNNNVFNPVHRLPILYWIEPSSSEGWLFQRQESKMFLVLALQGLSLSL